MVMDGVKWNVTISYLSWVTSSDKCREFDITVSRLSRYSEQFCGWATSGDILISTFLTLFVITALDNAG